MNDWKCIDKMVYTGTKEKQIVQYVFSKTFRDFSAFGEDLGMCTVWAMYRVYKQSNGRAHAFTANQAEKSDSFGWTPPFSCFTPVSVTWLRDNHPDILSYIKEDLGIRKYKGV